MEINASSEVVIFRVKDDACQELFDQVATEVSYTLKVNGFELVSLRCSPIELDALAVGFLVSEGILKVRADLDSVTVDNENFIVDVQLNCLQDGWEKDFQKKTITSGCGYGVTFTDGSKLQSLPLNQQTFMLSITKMQRLMKSFVQHSTLFKETGGVHSAAFVEAGEIVLFSEDIGRHNAVDKIIGKAFMQNIAVDNKMLLSSGRISGEIMTKIINIKIPVLISRAAPTCMSLNYAEFHGVTLVGFARGNRMNIYTHPQRLEIVS